MGCHQSNGQVSPPNPASPRSSKHAVFIAQSFPFTSDSPQQFGKGKKKKKKKVYNDAGRKDVICSLFPQSFQCYIISQIILCTWLPLCCGGKGCRDDKLRREAGGHSLNLMPDFMHIHRNDVLSIIYLPIISIPPPQLPEYKPWCKQNYACKWLC